MRPFQIVILGIFAFFGVIGIVMFATFRGASPDISEVPITLWGTLPAESVETAVGAYNRDASSDILLLYEEFRAEEFDRELVEAIAEGRGPDVILLSQDAILKHQAKLFLISFESFPERDFKDTFAELGELYITPNGIVGLPFLLDPIVMYWNRDTFSSAGYALPPKTWEELINIVGDITRRDEQNNIQRSAIALGEFQNIDHAKEILTMLFMQAGDPIITRGIDGDLDVTFGSRLGFPEIPVESALRFYTEFADPVKLLYSWNRSLASSKSAFISGDVALYLGFASEESELSSRNPNLNFDVTLVPQIKDTNVKKTFGNMHSLALLRSSPNIGAGFRTIVLMTQPDFLEKVSSVFGLPPVRRDMLAVEAPGAAGKTFYQSALIADAFLDPDSTETTSIYRRMVEDITSGRERISRSVINARDSLTELLP